MDKVKDWLLTLNPDDTAWCNRILHANSFEELEKLAQPIVSEIGWLNLEGLAKEFY